MNNPFHKITDKKKLEDRKKEQDKMGAGFLKRFKDNIRHDPLKEKGTSPLEKVREKVKSKQKENESASKSASQNSSQKSTQGQK